LRASPDEAVIIGAVLSAADKIHYEYQKRQAVMIGNEVARVLKRMFG
jgi:2-methylcitrate dehydratase PrpD